MNNLTTYYRAKHHLHDGFKINIRKTSTEKRWANEFLTKKEALTDINKYKAIADQKYKSFYPILEQLTNDNGFTINYIMDGDTHGIYEDYQYIAIEVNNYIFQYEI